MSKGAEKDYDFREKNRWRVRFWDEILRRLGPLKKTGLILYLAGPDDLDRQVAIGKGVPAQNLIAIDRKRANIQAIRSAGYPGIYGDVYDVLTTWPKASPVAAIVLDLCQGFQCLDDLRRLTMLCGDHPALKFSIIAINLQRGRDAETNEIREVAGRFAEKYLGVDAKHRGMIFALWYIVQHISALPVEWRTDPRVFDVLLDLFNPRAFAYQSGAVYFDSLVIDSGGRHFDLPAEQNETRRVDLYSHSKKAIALSTAATLAVRTRRLRA